MHTKYVYGKIKSKSFGFISLQNSSQVLNSHKIKIAPNGA